MRVYTLILTGFLASSVAAPAAAQNATRSVDDYLCTFAGKCGEQAVQSEDDSMEAPATKGMSVGRRIKAPSAAAASTAPTRGPAVSTPVLTTSRRANVAPTVQNRRSSPQLASVSSSPSRKATQSARADLRLSFLLDSAEMTSQAKAEAKIFAEALRRPELASKRFRIEGHTDASGSRDHNLSLSQRRAAAVADYLSGLGVPRSRFEVRGYGPDRPLDGGSAASPQNRRVEALLL